MDAPLLLIKIAEFILFVRAVAKKTKINIRVIGVNKFFDDLEAKVGTVNSYRN